MLKKIFKALVSDEMDIKERLFRIILVVGTIAIGAAILQGLTLVNAESLMMLYGIMFLAFVSAFILTFKYRNTEIASTILGVVLIIFALPVIFLQGGGVNSGAGLWMCLGIFYVFIMFSGRKLGIFLVLTILVDIGCYFIAYYYPEYVKELATPFEKCFDSLFAVLVVGLTVGIIMKFQLRVFDRERRTTDEQKKELEALSRSKDIFFASMSHEIRTPINSIMGLNELILREEPNDTIKEYAANIINSSRLLLGLVNDILDLSQLQNEQMPIVEEDYATKDMFYNITSMMQASMDEKKLKFIVKVDKTIPKGLRGDERRIRQIIVNLLNNAIKYTEEGSVSLTCTHEVQNDNTIMLKIAVADTGIGIRKEELDYLFDPFRRADMERNHRVEGTGLGLAIVQYLLTLMGGTISVDSIYTQGSLFTIMLPQKITDSAPMGELENVIKEKKAGVYYNRTFEAPDARILIVDDDDLNLIITTKLLQETKMSIDTAWNTEEFLRKTKSRYYNLILMDYMMPGKNGEELLHEVRKQENGLCRETPVVLLTANSFGEHEFAYLQMGFDGIVQKPIEAQVLEEEVLRHIPDELVEYRRDTASEGQGFNFVSTLQSKKRKKVSVITDSVSDIPAELLENYDIKMIDLYIKTEFGRFRDAKEIDVNNMSKYMSESESTAYSLAATVEEYEIFFAEALMEAEELVYISMAKGNGKCYSNAQLAAKGFDHVHVVDSGYISSAQGMVVLGAARMAKRGASAERICKEIQQMRKKINLTVLLPSARIFYQRGFTDAVTAKICDLFTMRPIIGISGSKMHIYGVRWGRLENAWRKCIRHHLRNIKHIDDDVIFVSHAALTVKQQELVLDEIHRCMKFKQVIFTQSSVSNVCNAGIGSLAFAVYRK